jgi:release factor glutamine methyltransferase
MNSKKLFHELVNGITIDDSHDEIRSMVYLLFEHFLSISRTDVFGEKEIELTSSAENKIRDAVRRVNTGEPVQYVLGETEFNGRMFLVNPSVLIPRPETEELVRLVIDHIKGHDKKHARILDIGTGSGCIAITLGLESPSAEIFATDVSVAALKVADENAKRLNAHVEFIQHDILLDDIPCRDLHVVVSNPPYIGVNEKSTMKDNVLLFEPHQALFVTGNDPLLFYAAIAKKAYQMLQSKGLLAVEISEHRGVEVMDLFKKWGYTEIELVKDLFGKDRIVKGIRP